MAESLPRSFVAAFKPFLPAGIKKHASTALLHYRRWRYRSNLDYLALLYGTDKNGVHFYTQHYQRYFASMRHLPLRILEIGVGGYEDTNEGAWSLRMWKRFFPNARIVGIDLFDKSHLSEDRITVLQCDQVDPVRLAAISAEHGPFDIIIDDGSHMNEHVIRTFGILFPMLKKPGFYAVEDLQTAYWPSWGGVRGQSSMDFLTSLTDGINHTEHLDRPPQPFDTEITEVAFFHNLCIIRKGENTEPSNAPHFIEAERSAQAL